MRVGLAVLGLATLDPPERFLGAHLRAGRARYMEATDHLTSQHPERRASPEDVEPGLAYALAAQTDHWLLDVDSIRYAFQCLPWVARAKPEELYLPRAVAHVALPLWTPQVGAWLIDRWRKVIAPETPEPRAAPRRHEPCTCGSGKKFGKCCGA